MIVLHICYILMLHCMLMLQTTINDSDEARAVLRPPYKRSTVQQTPNKKRYTMCADVRRACVLRTSIATRSARLSAGSNARGRRYTYTHNYRAVEIENFGCGDHHHMIMAPSAWYFVRIALGRDYKCIMLYAILNAPAYLICWHVAPVKVL